MEYLKNKFDTIVVGAGHAGCEAALACANLGLKVLFENKFLYRIVVKIKGLHKYKSRRTISDP